MEARLRARMLYHGAVVVMLGLLAGFPHAFVLTGQLAGEERAWHMAHLEGLLIAGARAALRADRG